jgi:hypothetical protein
MLFCADQRGAHWTALGDPGFVQAVRAAQRPLPDSDLRRQPPSSSPEPPSGKGLPGAKLNLFEPPPTVVVFSGGVDGLTQKRHAYWPLRERVPADEIGRHVRALAAHLEADMASTEPARILRLPGSVNRKTGIRASVERLTDDTYALAEVVGDLPDATEPAHRVRPGEQLRAARIIQVHERHVAVVSLLGVMRRWGTCEQVLIDAAVSLCRNQCATDPATPLDIRHVERTARDVAGCYPAGPACSWAMRREAMR